MTMGPALAASSPAPTATPNRNLAILLRTIDAVNAREVPEELLAPTFRMESDMTAVTDYVYRGAMGLRDWMNDVFEVLATGARYELDEIIAADDELVVAAFHITGRGARSNVPVALEWVGIMWFRGGLITRIVGRASRREALRTLGL
jgi:ketosteroid isomerase-like protein